MQSGNSRRLLLFAGVIVAPAAVLSVLSWTALGSERREETKRHASAILRLTLREIEGEVRRVRDDWWRDAADDPAALGKERGVPVALLAAGGSRTEPPLSLEERLFREDPDLLLPLSRAVELEFARDRAGSAASLYAELQSQVESPAAAASLLHARARASARAGMIDEARSSYEELADRYPAQSGESGIPYGILARTRLVEMDPTPAECTSFLSTLASSNAPARTRSTLLRSLLDLPLPADSRLNLHEALFPAQALERLEELASREKAPFDRIGFFGPRTFLLTVRGTVGAALPLVPFPGTGSRDRIDEAKSEGFALVVEGASILPEADSIAREASSEFPPLALTAVLVDPSLLRASPGRLLLTGGLVACLLAALLFGVWAILRTVNQELRIARLKSDFVSGVSHDLKTPLTSIRMFAEMLEGGKVSAEEKRREYHRLIHRESLRLSRLVDNVLDFSRVEEGRKTLSLETRPLNDLVAAAADSFRIQIEGETVIFRVRAPDERLTVRADGDALVGAILNLLDNALKYGGKGIELALERRGDRAEISVRDDGPGIPPEERKRIFEKFYRGSSAVSGPSGGAGLGLSIVRFTAEAHGGTVSVESNPDCGSSFRISLPLLPTADC